MQLLERIDKIKQEFILQYIQYTISYDLEYNEKEIYDINKDYILCDNILEYWSDAIEDYELVEIIKRSNIYSYKNTMIIHFINQDDFKNFGVSFLYFDLENLELLGVGERYFKRIHKQELLEKLKDNKKYITADSIGGFVHSIHYHNDNFIICNESSSHRYRGKWIDDVCKLLYQDEKLKTMISKHPDKYFTFKLQNNKLYLFNIHNANGKMFTYKDVVDISYLYHIIYYSKYKYLTKQQIADLDIGKRIAWKNNIYEF